MTEKVEMTAEERQEFEAFKAEKERKRREQERKEQRRQYAEMVDDEVATTIPQLRELSEQIKQVKDTVFGNFDAILRMKSEITGVKADGQNSHTFTTSDGRSRLILGVNTIDGYRDTVEDGIAMVKQYIEGLAKDDAQGNIKASRVLQLRKMADDSGDERFIDGVRIIEESYQPAVSKKYIRAQYRNDKGAWCYIPLGMTDVD